MRATLFGSVAKNILAAFSCAEEPAAASISCVAGKFLQHDPLEGYLRSQKNSASTVAFKLSIVRSFFEHLEAVGIVPLNPSLDIRMEPLCRLYRTKIYLALLHVRV